MSLYDRMQATASRLLEKYNQGVIEYVPPPTTSGDDWNPVQVASDPIAIKGTVQGVSAEYVDGETVQATDLELTASVFDQEPVMSGKFRIDGQVMQTIRIMQKPAAGTVVVWKVIVRA